MEDGEFLLSVAMGTPSANRWKFIHNGYYANTDRRIDFMQIYLLAVRSNINGRGGREVAAKTSQGVCSNKRLHYT